MMKTMSPVEVQTEANKVNYGFVGISFNKQYRYYLKLFRP